MRSTFIFTLLLLQFSTSHATWPHPYEQDPPEVKRRSQPFIPGNDLTLSKKSKRTDHRHKPVLFSLKTQRYILNTLQRNRWFQIHPGSWCNHSEDGKHQYAANVKHKAVKSFIAEQRFLDIQRYQEKGRDPQQFINYEKWIKPTTGSLNFDLPPLCEEEPLPLDLSNRIQRVFDTKVSATFTYTDPRTGESKKRETETSLFGTKRPEDKSIVLYAQQSSKYRIYDTSFSPNRGSSYARNQIGRRLDRFLGYIEQRLKTYHTIKEPSEKMHKRQQLNRLVETLHDVEIKCIDRALSALDEAEKLMIIIDDPILTKSHDQLSKKDRQEKEEKLFGLAVHDYKKFLLTVLSEKGKRSDEARAAYLRYLKLTQQSLGLGILVRKIYYDKYLKKEHEKPFAEVYGFVLNELSIEGFLYFISATTTIPDELRQVDYQSHIAQELNFDEEFYTHLDLWNAAKKEGLWNEVDTGKNTNPFFKAFLQKELRGEDLMEAYTDLLEKPIQEKAQEMLQRFGFIVSHPYYVENLFQENLYRPKTTFKK